MGAALQIQDIEATYQEAKKTLYDLIEERARRLTEQPDRYFAPEDRDCELVGQIHARRGEFLRLRTHYHSARGEYLFVGCAVGEHKRCRREITREGALLRCACECHIAQPERKEESKR